MIEIVAAVPEDVGAVLALQKLAYESEARLYNDWSLPALTQTFESLAEEFSSAVVLKAVINEEIVGSVRAKITGDTCEIGRLIVHPNSQRQGIGSELLMSIESKHLCCKRYELFTGSISAANISLYQRHDYSVTHSKPLSDSVSIIFLEKLVLSK